MIIQSLSLFSKLHSSLLASHSILISGDVSTHATQKGIEGNSRAACRRQGGTRIRQDIAGYRGRGGGREERRFLLVTGYTKAWRNATQTNIANKLPIQFSYAENTAAVRRYEPASTFHQFLLPLFHLAVELPMLLTSRAPLIFFFFFFFSVPCQLALTVAVMG